MRPRLGRGGPKEAQGEQLKPKKKDILEERMKAKSPSRAYRHLAKGEALNPSPEERTSSNAAAG